MFQSEFNKILFAIIELFTNCFLESVESSPIIISTSNIIPTSSRLHHLNTIFTFAKIIRFISCPVAVSHWFHWSSPNKMTFSYLIRSTQPHSFPWSPAARNLKYVTKELCDTRNMRHMKNVTHDICDTWNMRHMKYETHEIWDTWDMWHMRYVTHEICDTWDMWNMIYVTHEICISWAFSAELGNPAPQVRSFTSLN